MVVVYQILPSVTRRDVGLGRLAQRGLGTKLRKPQSWIYNCESANRRIDVTELVAWCRACGANPRQTFDQLLDQLR